MKPETSETETGAKTSLLINDDCFGDQCVTRPKIWTIPIPRLFFGTKFFRDRFRDFFRYQNFSRPIPRLFSVLIFFETDSETFFGTKFFRDRFRYHPKKCKNPGNGTRPGPKSTQIIWKISRLVPIFFFGTKFFRDRFRDFFRYLIFPRPVPRLFSVPIFFETGSETFFGTKFFWDRFRYHQNKWQIPGNRNSQDRDVTLWLKDYFSTSATIAPLVHEYRSTSCGAGGWCSAKGMEGHTLFLFSSFLFFSQVVVQVSGQCEGDGRTYNERGQTVRQFCPLCPHCDHCNFHHPFLFSWFLYYSTIYQECVWH